MLMFFSFSLSMLFSLSMMNADGVQLLKVIAWTCMLEKVYNRNELDEGRKEDV